MSRYTLEFLKYQENYIPFNAPRHTHTCNELVYYISGSGETSIENDTYTYTPNSFTLIPSGKRHNEKAYENSNLIFIGFSSADDKIPFKSGIYNDFDNSIVFRKLKEMESELNKKKPYYSILLNNMAESLLINIARNYFKPVDNTDDYCVMYVKQYIDEHFKDNLNLYELSAMSGYSYDWFRHIFKEKSGYSLSQYILSKKLEHSVFLLSNSDKTVTEISSECLFSSASQFITQFKKYKRITPMEYRRISQNKQNVGLYNR